MARGYLNSISFPAPSLGESLDKLAALRAGIAYLIRNQALQTPVMCSVRASRLALSPRYQVLAEGMQVDGGRHRDTILFFLNVLDQQTPAQNALTPELQAEMDPHLVEEGLGSEFDENAASVLVACALDEGVLLSLGTADRWQGDDAGFELMTNAGLRRVVVDNVCDVGTAERVAQRSAEARSRHVFDNWDALTGSAAKSPQVDEWFEECRRRPGLEQVIMRSVDLAHTNSYRADGDLVKKLEGGGDIAVFEIRAWFNGSNNLRLLFGRDGEGRAIYGFGGLKSHPSWYKTAIPQSVAFIRELLSAGCDA